MQVRCVATSLSEEQKSALGASEKLNPVFQISPGRIYTALALTFVRESVVYGRTPLVDIKDDGGRLIPVPLCLFEITDPRLSQYWLARTNDDFDLLIWPKQFFQASFHERLSERDPGALTIFSEVVESLERESRS